MIQMSNYALNKIVKDLLEQLYRMLWYVINVNQNFAQNAYYQDMREIVIHTRFSFFKEIFIIDSAKNVNL